MRLIRDQANAVKNLYKKARKEFKKTYTIYVDVERLIFIQKRVSNMNEEKARKCFRFYSNRSIEIMYL